MRISDSGAFHFTVLGALSALFVLKSLGGDSGNPRNSASDGKKPPVKTTAAERGKLTHLKGVEVNGKVFRLGQSRDCRAIVLIFLSTECPISNGYIPDLNTLFRAFRHQGVEFYGVVSAPGVSRKSAEAHRKGFGIRFPVLFDASGEIRRKLKATHTPESFVLTPISDLLYRGLIDDRFADLGQKRNSAELKRHYVKEVLNDVLTGRRPQIANTTPIGCRLEDRPNEASNESITYSRDIAPIIQGNCSSCHRPGQSAPFSLLTYEDVCRHANQICDVTGSGRMPPWKAARNFGHFRDERGLTPAEITLMKNWTNSGKAKGEIADLPKMPAFTEGWTLGKPDLILRMDQAFEVPAGGDDIHHCFVLPTLMRENRLISAVEFLPGNAKVVHHAAFYLDAKRRGRRLDAADPDQGYRGFGNPGFLPTTTFRNWLPGFTPRHLPKGMGRWIPRGSDLILEIHYRPSGKIESDRSVVGIHFAPRSTRQIVSEIKVLNLDLEIPAGKARHRHSASYTLPANITLLDAAPHMHLLGREMKAVAHLPDGTSRSLIWIRDWDFDWQEQYMYAQPIRLPKGTKIVVDCYYDNSRGNPLNPSSPPIHVKWGSQTKDSMGLCHFQFTCDSLREMHVVKRHYEKYLLGQSAQQRFAGSSNRAD